ncbi:hypothetical protein [Streptomyces sp. NPDC004042]|uniref:hypothetical protein n=1 Tax=Streptomyces sp. NPDC004042 TaxID=3154451 RepID=UPI0033A1DE01
MPAASSVPSASSGFSSPLAGAWLRGIAVNPSAGPGVQLRLLRSAVRAAWEPLCEHGDLPQAVVEAVLAHPSPQVRGAFARNHRADPAQRGRLAHDPDALVRARLAGGPRPRSDRVVPLPDDALVTLLTAEDRPGHDPLVTADEIRQELAFSGQIPPSFPHRMTGHDRSELRAYAAGYWQWLTPAERETLRADPDPAVREAARRRIRDEDPEAMRADLPDQDCLPRRTLLYSCAVSAAVAEACLTAGRDLTALAHNRYTPAFAVQRLARHPDPEVRALVAARADLGPGLLAALAEDPDERVRLRARTHPLPRTWAQRDALDRVIGRGADQIGVVARSFGEPDPGWYADCAASGDPLLRRAAASWPDLPADAAARLAADPDPDVRHLLACNHPAAPPELLLEAFLALPRQRAHLRTLPRLPRTGLRHLLGHADAEVRALAAGDPTLEEPPVRLLDDPDAAVRRAAAANPRLPGDLLARLLEDPATAEDAAANAALTDARLHALLDRAGAGVRFRTA